MDNDKIISTLNGLIETCRDGQNGFKEAAENAKSPDLKTFFNQIALERAQCVGELQQEVVRLGGDPENTGSTAAALHRVWMSIKGTLTGKDDQSILNEAERGEDSAVKAYEDALKEDLPANIRALVERQFNQIRETHNRVRQLRDAKSATTGR
ncbi:MAG TPA: PA2169 family four-helix-bundle protein [Blastocatellia bacterium]|nr:PA2169 family four-helix-bundle protein [Blastocatellia bacterium]